MTAHKRLGKRASEVLSNVTHSARTIRTEVDTLKRFLDAGNRQGILASANLILATAIDIESDVKDIKEKTKEEAT